MSKDERVIRHGSDVARQIDLLTGAWKRDYFEAQLAKAVSAAKRSKKPLCLIHLDVDNLQELNDTHSREALDASLAWLALATSKLVDGRGPIGRLGGDEFAIYLPGFTLEKAKRLAEQIRETVPRTHHHSAAGGYRLTVSVGVVALKAEEPWGNFAQAAEDACQKAKQGGRDGVASR